MTAATPLRRNPLALAFALALAAAVSLGLARFSYALQLPPMRAELHWICSAIVLALAAVIALRERPLKAA